MATAKRRQTVLIAAAVLVSLYGLFSLAAGRGKEIAGPDREAEELKALMAQTSAQITAGRPGAFDTYVVGRSKSGWRPDLFSARSWTGAGSGGGAKDKASPSPVFVYNGYVERNNRKVAVINNGEYRAGEQIGKNTGFFVKGISPAGVLIENRR